MKTENPLWKQSKIYNADTLQPSASDGNEFKKTELSIATPSEEIEQRRSRTFCKTSSVFNSNSGSGDNTSPISEKEVDNEQTDLKIKKTKKLKKTKKNQKY